MGILLSICSTPVLIWTTTTLRCTLHTRPTVEPQPTFPCKVTNLTHGLRKTQLPLNRDGSRIVSALEALGKNISNGLHLCLMRTKFLLLLRVVFLPDKLPPLARVRRCLLVNLLPL